MPLCVVWGADGEGKEKTPASTHGGLVAKFKVTTDPEGQWVQLSGKRYSIPLLRAHFGCEMCWAMTVTKKPKVTDTTPTVIARSLGYNRIRIQGTRCFPEGEL